MEVPVEEVAEVEEAISEESNISEIEEVDDRKLLFDTYYRGKVLSFVRPRGGTRYLKQLEIQVSKSMKPKNADN